MATNYSITIINESSVDDRVYLLFQEKPVENPLDAPQVFYNIFAEAPPIASGDGSQVTFNLQKEFFAICGIPPAPLAKGVKISTSSFLPVTLAQGGASPSPGTSTFLTSIRGAPKWDNAATSTTDDALNGFAINTDTSFNYPNKNHFFLGLGARDPFNSNKVVPVASMEAQPGQEYLLYPQVVYYICTGTFQQGTIVDIKTIGKKLKIDFTKVTIPDVTYTQLSNGTYDPLDANSKKAMSMQS